MHPKISVIIPCYNLEKYIPKCLDSIEKQNNFNVEYVFINDGSTDSTRKIIQEFCDKHSFCSLINKSNGGVSSARNEALSVVRGEYIYLLDGDDILTDNAIIKMLDVIRDSKADIILSSVSLLNENQSDVYNLEVECGDYDIESFFQNIKYFPTVPKIIYKSAIIKEHKIFFNSVLKYGEVYNFTLNVLNYSNIVRVVNEIFFHYVRHDGSATININVDRDVTIIDTIEEYVNNKYKLEKYSSFWNTAFRLFMTFCYTKYLRIQNDSNDILLCMKRVLDNPSCKTVIKKVAFGKNIPIKQRLEALYIHFTNVRGFIILRRIIQLYNFKSNV